MKIKNKLYNSFLTFDNLSGLLSQQSNPDKISLLPINKENNVNIIDYINLLYFVNTN